ncbi:MAG: aldo/keto reductase [Planctomycetes bacterium]|jgi:aryl-alcohol dehydrogenase-like predicted oxidoreductase|nr:aldo/keto reductase [Planctomycetota bacterium]
MRTTTIDGTAIEVSRLSLGTASLHHLFFHADRCRLLDRAAAIGITHFDTSPYYGHGLAEITLGAFLGGRRAAFTVATKVGLYPKGAPAKTGLGVWLRKALGKAAPGLGLPAEDWSVSHARASLEASLKRLRTEYVDFLFVHEPRIDEAAADALKEWMCLERARGTIRAFGVAGVETRIGELVRAGHPLARIVQTRDTVDGHEAEFLIRAGRGLQFTYGYLSSRKVDCRTTPLDTMTAALARNTLGAVIVSSRSPERITALAGLAP